MRATQEASEYGWSQIDNVPSHKYLAPRSLEVVRALAPEKILDLGCGDGRLTGLLASKGFSIDGTDFSEEGIARAQLNYARAHFWRHDISNPFCSSVKGRYDVVIAVEVIEHLLLPRQLFHRSREALKPGGHLLVTTPFHGYWKNLALSLTGRWDRHFDVSWDYGHVKFFSPRTLGDLAVEQGFEVVGLKRLGRVAPFAASMSMLLRLAEEAQA